MSSLLKYTTFLYTFSPLATELVSHLPIFVSTVAASSVTISSLVLFLFTITNLYPITIPAF